MASAPTVARSWDKAQVLTAVFLASVWLALAHELARASRRLDPWIVGDWLINYAGGFVRRGLPGETIRLLWKATGVAPPAWVLCLQLVLYAVFFLSAFRLLRSRLTDWDSCSPPSLPPSSRSGCSTPRAQAGRRSCTSRCSPPMA